MSDNEPLRPLRRNPLVPAKPEVHRITGAGRSLTEDIHARQVRYVVSMGVRTLCFVLAIVTGGWLRIVFFIGALVLPYLAVVLANASREQPTVGPDVLPPPARPAIERGPGPGTS